MKIKQVAGVLEAQGVGTSSSFRIAASAHAFKMLSSGLYSDKISAVLREIGCNAADAHVVAGIADTPIEVKLPNQLDPLFYIQDRGPGLSDAQVRELYTTYFASTKQDSNDFTGAFGLGSKSPFSYTDSFTVTTCQQGRMRVYMAHLDKQGSPVITLLDDQPVTVDWQTGVRVSFPVRVKDFTEFQAKARSVYSWFTPTPNVIGLEDNWWELDEPWYDGKHCRLYAQNAKLEPGVLMGNVRYPLSMTEIQPTYLFRTVSTKQDAYFSLGYAKVLLKLPIGTVQVAASREGLQYDDETKAALKEALSAAFNELLLAAGTRLKLAYTSTQGWARRLAVRNVHGKIPYTVQQNVFQSGAPVLQQLGLSTLEIAELEKLCTTSAVGLPRWVGSTESGVSVKFVTDSTNSWGRKAHLVEAGALKRGTSLKAVSLPILPQVAIYVADCDKAEERMLQFMEGTYGLFVTCRGRDRRAEALALGERLACELGGVPLIRVSSLPELTVDDASGPKEAMVQFVEFSRVTSVGTADWLRCAPDEPLSSLGANQRYYLVRDGAPGAATMNVRLEYLGTDGVLQEVGWQEWEAGISLALANFGPALERLGLSDALPKGFVLVTPTQVKRLKLLENGFKPLIGFARELVQSSRFAEAVSKSGLTPYGSPFSIGASHPGAALLALLQARVEFARVFLQLPLAPDERQELQSMLGSAFSDSQIKSRREPLEQFINPLWRVLAVPKAVFVAKQQMADELVERHPALALVSAEKLRHYASNEATLLRMLRYVFAPLSEAQADVIKQAA